MKSSGNPSKAGRKTDDVLGGGGFPIGQWMHSLSDAPRRCMEFVFVLERLTFEIENFGQSNIGSGCLEENPSFGVTHK